MNQVQQNVYQINQIQNQQQNIQNHQQNLNQQQNILHGQNPNNMIEGNGEYKSRMLPLKENNSILNINIE